MKKILALAMLVGTIGHAQTKGDTTIAICKVGTFAARVKVSGSIRIVSDSLFYMLTYKGKTQSYAFRIESRDENVGLYNLKGQMGSGDVHQVSIQKRVMWNSTNTVTRDNFVTWMTICD